MPEAPLPPMPISSSVGVVPLGAEEAAPTRTTGIATNIQEPGFEPPVELAPQLEPSIVEPSGVEPSGVESSGFEPSVVEDTVVSGMQLLAPEPTSEPSWAEVDVEGQAKAAFGGWDAPAKEQAMAATPAKSGSLPGLDEFLALVLNGAPAGSLSSGARERECPSCKTRVFASADELCPNCGDLLDAGEPLAPVANGHADEPPMSVPEPVEAAVDAPPTAAPVEPLSISAGVTPDVEPTSQAGLRECTHCHNRVFASQDELCPECGDSLETAPLVEDSQTAAGPIEERDCGHCGTRVVGTPTSPCPACGKVLGAMPEPAVESVAVPGLRAAPTPNESVDDRAFETTFVGPGAAEPFAEASSQGTQLCPFCIEEIPGEATTCPACGKALRGAEVEAKVTDPDDEKTVAELPPPAPAPAPARVPAPAPAPVPAPALARVPAPVVAAPSPVAAPAPMPAAAAPVAPAAAPVAPAPTRPRAPTLRPELARPIAAAPAPAPVSAPALVAAAPAAPVTSTAAEPANEPTVADAADGAEATVPDPMASEAELVLGEDPGTSPRDERFPSPKIQRSREQVSLPGRKGKPAAPVPAPVAAAAAPTNPTAAAPAKGAAPPWQGASAEPAKIMPVRAVAAPPNIGAARGTAAELPPPKRGAGLLIGVGVVVVGLAAASAGAVFVFGMGGKFPGGGKGDGAVATPLPVETTPAVATATPLAAVSATPIETVSATPIETAVVTQTPVIAIAPTPVARMSEVAISTPVATTPLVRPTPIPTSTRAAVVATPLAPTPTPVVSRTPVVMTPPPATPTPVVVVATPTPPKPTPPPATPPPATPPPATPAATQVASVDPRATALAAAVKQCKSADPDTIASGVKALKRLVKEDASYADAWFWLGFGSGRIEENSAACDAFRKYLKLAPNGAYVPTATATVRECDQ